MYGEPLLIDKLEKNVEYDVPFIGDHRPRGWTLTKVFRQESFGKHIREGYGYAYITVQENFYFVGEFVEDVWLPEDERDEIDVEFEF